MTEVFGEDAYNKMLPMLRDVIDGGTGARVRARYGIKAPMGGKTGTTNFNADGWFMAFTPSLVAGTWVGGEDPSIHFDRITQGQGAEMALPIFALFMKNVYANKDLGYSETEDFNMSNQFVATSDDGKYEGDDEIMNFSTEDDENGESNMSAPSSTEVGIDGIFD